MKKLLFALGLLLPAVAFAQTSCAALGAWLAAQPTILPVNATTPLTTLTGTGSNARCEANFIYSSRGGPEFGYDAVVEERRLRHHDEPF